MINEEFIKRGTPPSIRTRATRPRQMPTHSTQTSADTQHPDKCWYPAPRQVLIPSTQIGADSKHTDRFWPSYATAPLMSALRPSPTPHHLSQRRRQQSCAPQRWQSLVSSWAAQRPPPPWSPPRPLVSRCQDAEYTPLLPITKHYTDDNNTTQDTVYRIRSYYQDKKPYIGYSYYSDKIPYIGYRVITLTKYRIQDTELLHWQLQYTYTVITLTTCCIQTLIPI